jgi:hypothetical protein
MRRQLLSLLAALALQLVPCSAQPRTPAADGKCDSALYFTQTASHGKIKVTGRTAEGAPQLQIILKQIGPYTNEFTDAPHYKVRGTRVGWRLQRRVNTTRYSPCLLAQRTQWRARPQARWQSQRQHLPPPFPT